MSDALLRIGIPPQMIGRVNHFIQKDESELLLTASTFFEKKLIKVKRVSDLLPNIDTVLVSNGCVFDFSFSNSKNHIDGKEFNDEAKSVGQFFIQAHNVRKNFDEFSFMKDITSQTPNVSYLLVFFSLFILLTPLYSNVFNSKLIYNDTFISVFFVTSVFILLFLLEFFLKKIISNSVKEIISKNIKEANCFFFELMKWNRNHDLVTKIRNIEQNLPLMWESAPLLIVDSVTSLLLLSILVLVLGKFSTVIVVYYAIFLMVCMILRHKSYLNTLSGLNLTSEKTNILYSVDKNKMILPFISMGKVREYCSTILDKNEDNRVVLSKDSYFWSEVLRFNSFLSMVVLFTSLFFALKAEPQLWSSTIALMLVNGRIISSLSMVANRYFQLKTSKKTIFDNSKYIFEGEDKEKIRSLISLDTFEHISAINLVPNEVTLMSPVFEKFKIGRSYAVIGKSGAGKTSLLRVLSGLKEYSGELSINGVDFRKLSTDFFENNVLYIDSQLDFFHGSMYENLKLLGIDDINDMTKLLSKLLPDRKIDNDLIYVKNVFELHFSEGEKRRIILMALSKLNKKIVIMDEPTNCLNRSDAMSLFNDMLSAYPDSLLIVATHQNYIAEMCSVTIDLNSKINKFNLKVL